MKIPNLILALGVLSFVFLSSCEKDDLDLPKELAVFASGFAEAFPIKTTIPGTDLEVEGTAFTLDVFDKKGGQKIGSLTDIDVAAETFPDGSMRSETYTIFTFDGTDDKIILNSIIEAKPIDDLTLRAFIEPQNAKGNLIDGTGKYNNAKGGCTLEATLDVSLFEQSILGFECQYNMTFN